LSIDESQKAIRRGLSLQQGCENGCLYCFARFMSSRILLRRAPPNFRWEEPVLISELIDRARRIVPRKDETILFPFLHDITERNREICTEILQAILAGGGDVVIVTKPRWETFERLCADLVEHKDQVLMRVTIGSQDDDVLKFWEPNTSTFAERITCLETASRMGFDTSASVVPFLDPRTEDVIELVTYLNSLPTVTRNVWIGKITHLRRILGRAQRTAGENGFETILSLMEATTDDRIRDLHSRIIELDLEKIVFFSSITNVIEGRQGSCYQESNNKE